MAVTAQGINNVNDQIFQGEVIFGNTVNQVGPLDGDLDTGDGFPVLSSSGNELRGVHINHAEPPAASHTTINAVARTKTSTGGTPTQGSCAFVGGAVEAAA